jgi:Holliday junction DNA helicase RuvB
MVKIIEHSYEHTDNKSIIDTKPLITPTFTPTCFDEFIGQKELKERLKIYIESARKRNAALDHLLFFGPAGLGKTTLIDIIGTEFKKKVKHTSGPVLHRASDLVSILSTIREGEILFIDEIHRLPMKIEEILYSAMEQYKIDIIIGAGSTTKVISLPLPPFSLFGATTKVGLLSKPLQSRFNGIEKFEWYTNSELAQIVIQTADFFNIKLDAISASEIASVSRGTPRIAKKIMAKVRDYAIVKTKEEITQENIQEVFRFFNILPGGFTPQDRLILKKLAESAQPISLDSLAALIHEEPGTIEEFYEPFLIHQELILRTPRGRILNPQKKEKIEKIIHDIK